MGLGGSGPQATTEDMADDVKHAGASALALVQGLLDVGATPTHAVWFVTRGAQVLDQDLATGPAGKRLGQLSGSPLWGIGKVVARAAAWPLVSLGAQPKGVAWRCLMSRHGGWRRTRRVLSTGCKLNRRLRVISSRERYGWQWRPSVSTSETFC